MATNGKSARKWLAEQGDQVSATRVQQIKASLQSKIEGMEQAKTDGSDEYQGLVEALDVVDMWLMEHENPLSSSDAAVQLDTGLLGEPLETVPVLSPQEKQQAFQKLLQNQ